MSMHEVVREEWRLLWSRPRPTGEVALARWEGRFLGLRRTAHDLGIHDAELERIVREQAE